MNSVNFLFISFLLLAPVDYFGECGVKVIYGEKATDHDLRKSSDNISSTFYKSCHEYPRSKEVSQVKVRYEPTQEENCLKEKKLKEKDERECQNELGGKKDEISKWREELYEKTKNREMKKTCKPTEEKVKIDSTEDKFNCHSQSTKGQILCAECDKCEIQIKSNGEGVMLKCQQCHQVASDEIVFPSGNNQKIVKLP
ncbi:hypothetical protein RUM43_014431 [Polyplax serrata]|uniref:Uncharacterized protein n=1 Tax=Polyplax serrata TaxID=468196 RepID=A0AAN8NIZ8_POLSC